jgi:predicted transcriptional regulator
MSESLIRLTAEIITAHVKCNVVSGAELVALVPQVHSSLAAIGSTAKPAHVRKGSSVSTSASVTPDYIICMECGKKQKMLRRHLKNAHSTTAEQYRKSHGLRDTYPMTAPNYSKRRRELALRSGLGRKGRVLGQGWELPVELEFDSWNNDDDHAKRQKGRGGFFE